MKPILDGELISFLLTTIKLLHRKNIQPGLYNFMAIFEKRKGLNIQNFNIKKLKEMVMNPKMITKKLLN